MSYFDGDDDFNKSDSGSESDSDFESSVEELGKKIVGGGIDDDEVDEELADIEDDDVESLDDDEDSLADDIGDEDMEGGAKDEDLEEGEVDEEEEKKAKRTKKIAAKTVYKKPIVEMDEEDEEDDDGEAYLQKFDNSINNNYIVNFHPECVLQNYDEILSMVKVIRDSNGNIIDDLHRTIPYITKYERARILGQRAKQINSGATPFIKVPENVIDGYVIAELELKEKRIPFIIRRPLPNGGSEYWSLRDLEDISF
jgi:DNA-directed RNA polymerase I, II, and III subunit RPABC2